MIGHHCIKSTSKMQKVLALSSAEAETYGMVGCSAEILGLQACARDLGLEYDGSVYADASAALGIVMRRGVGKVRHIRTQSLWLQEAHATKRLAFEKVDGSRNCADLMTKHLSDTLLSRHLEHMRAIPVEGRAESAPTLNSLMEHKEYFLGTVEIEPKKILKGIKTDVNIDEKEKKIMKGMNLKTARRLRVDGGKRAENIEHTCKGINSMKVRRWGDDEESQVKEQACLACIGELNDSSRDRRAIDTSSSANVLVCETRKVSFHPLVRIRRIPPYSEVYGLHPRLFDFDKYGNLIMVGVSVSSLDRESVCAQAPGGGVRTHTPQTDMIDGGMRRGGDEQIGRR